MQRGTILKKTYELGFANVQDFRSCAQCTVAAVQDTLGLRNDFIFRAAYGLSGGYSNIGDGPCGGYSGGCIMISLFFGRRREFFNDDEENKLCTKNIVKRLHDMFIEKYGTIICKEIQKKIFGRTYNLWDSRDMAQFDEDGGHTEKCNTVVGLASQWAVELILDEIENRNVKLQNYDFLRYISEFPY
jgi:C_GCAxxG_C_C family probable redox protein